ncbi:SdpI family protein [Georgenia phoenicis]|uniref:SdpI family protein n=1 Tax=unclassified Georgenia TaxID=2626815 RepID=UPI0039B0544D
MSEAELAATVLACGLLLVSLATHAVAWTTRAGQLSRNDAFGIRTRSTQASDEAWHAAHLAALPWLTRAYRVGYTGAALALVLALALAVFAGSISVAAL